MALQQRLEQSQKLILTQTMLQSLELLQLPADDLQDFLQEAALSNPMLEVEELPLPDITTLEMQRGREIASLCGTAFSSWEEKDASDFTNFFLQPKSFAGHLKEQLGQMKELDGMTLARCLFLVDSLNSSGYLDCPLEELAKDIGQSVFDMEQALFIVQTLDPLGVGARSLTECLLLQLAEGRHFTEINIHLIRFGLPLVARRDMRALRDLLHASEEEVRQAVRTIRALNPIPSRGFAAEGMTSYIRPEARVRCESGEIFVETNDQAVPRVRLAPDYCAMLAEENDREVRDYLLKKQAEAKALMTSLDNRMSTILRVLCAAVQVQREHFLNGGDLRPLTMQQLADQLALNISTVSRALKGKYLQFGTRVFPARDLLTATLQAAGGEVSVEMTKKQIRRCIAAEDPASPLSDEAIAQALAVAGVTLSRRTVAKYRSEMGIPVASARRHRGL